MRKTLIAMLGLVAIGMWAFPAMAGVTSDPPPAKEYQSLDGRAGAVGASARGGNSQMTLSGTVLKASAVDETVWFLYPGACQQRAGIGGTWTPRTTAQADSLDTYSVGGTGGYTKLDLSLKESIWGTPSFIAGQTPPILVDNPGQAGARMLWCGKYEPNFVVDVGYPNQTFQILYIDTGAHAADYTMTYVMNVSTEIDYDYLHLIGGGDGLVDPIGNSRAKLDEVVSTQHSGPSDLLITWTGSIQTTQTISTTGGFTAVTGHGSAQPSTVTATITIAAEHRALYFLFTADCGFSHEDGQWPVGAGILLDEISISGNFPGTVAAGGLYSDQARNNATDSGVTPPTTLGIRGTYGTSGFISARVAPGVGDLWQIVQGNFASTSDACQAQKNDAVDLMFFGVDAGTKKTIPGIFNAVVSCTFPVPVGTASIVALWGEYLDLPGGSGYVQTSEYRFYKGGSWSNWESTSASGGVITSVIKTWLVDGDELAAAVQGDSVQVRYILECIPFFATDGVTCGQETYGILYDDLRLEVRSGVPAPLLGIFPSQGPQTTFIDGTQGGVNCGTPPCWPGIRGSALGTISSFNIAVHDNVNSTLGDSTAIGLATGLRKNGMGINWRRAFSKSTIDGGNLLLPGVRASNGAGQFGGFNPNFDTPRMIFRFFDPATLTWSAFDSTELFVDNLQVAAGDSIAAAAFGAPVFRMTWPPLDKAGQSLPGGFTLNGQGAYDNLRFLPRGTRMQYYWKAVDIAGGTIHQFSSDNIAREREDLPPLPGSGIIAPDIIEFDILPRKYPNGNAGTLLAGRSDTPILNLDGAHTAWSFQYDPMTQALRGLGVRADRYRLLQGLNQGNNFGGHELTGPPDNQRALRGSNYFPNLTEYPLVSLMAGWYKIIIQSSHNRAARLDDESDSRALEEWWVTDTGVNGGDRCIFVSGDDYFNALLNRPAGEAKQRRLSYGQNVLGVNSAAGAWSGTVSTPYPTINDGFANPDAGPGLVPGYLLPIDGGCPTPNRFDVLSKQGGPEYQASAFYPGGTEIAAVATHAERDPGGSADNDRNKTLGYGFSMQYIRKTGVPTAAANYVRSGVEERMRVMYKFLTSCRGPRSGAPTDTAKCWPCPTDANMTGNWASMGATFETSKYGPLYAIQDNQAATGVELEPTSEAPRLNKLEGNFPNPFNPQTTIKLSAAQAGKVSLRIFNVGGQLVRTLTAKVEVGANEVRWNGKRDDGVALPSGIYFYKVKFADGTETGSRMALVK